MRHRVALLLVVVLLLALGGSAVVWRMARERTTSARAAPERDEGGPVSPSARAALNESDARLRAHGIVVDEAGGAVAGAQVAAFPLTLAEAFDPAGAGVRTDAQGRFAVALPGGAPAYGLFARAAGYAPRVVEPVTAGETVRIVLAPGAALFGRVTDMEGGPVAGAHVRYLGLLAGVRVVAETVSAEDGAYRVATAPGALARVEVTAEGFSPLLVRDGPFQGERDLVLACGGTVRVRVIDADTDAPVPGVSVCLWRDHTREPVRRFGGVEVTDPFMPRSLGERSTGPDGVAEFAGVPSHGFHFGPGTILGYAQLSAAGSFPATTGVEMPADGGVVECVLRRWPTARLIGRVVDPEGAPVAGAVVQANPWTPARVLLDRTLAGPNRACTDADGRYRVEVPARTDEETGIMVSLRESWVPFAVVQVRAACITRVPDFVLGPPPEEVTDVEVVDPEGDPIRWAEVSHRADTRGARTDEAGQARLLGERGAYVYVRPRAHAFAVAPAAPRVRVVVERGEPVAGRVVWKDEAPVAGALVRLGHAVGCGAQARTDADGAFRFEHVPAGTCEVSAHSGYRGNYGRVDLVARAKDIPAGTTDVRLVLDREGFVPVADVRGTVSVDTTGEPIARFLVKLYKDDRILTARRVGVGRFEVGVPAGEWYVSVSAPGYVDKGYRLEVRPGVPVPDQRLVLQPATTVSGHIRSSGALAGGRIELIKTDNAWFAGEGTIDAEGNYRVEGVPPGEYFARVSVGQTALADRAWSKVGVGAGVAEVRFDFDVEPAGVLDVFVAGFQELRGFDSIGGLTIRDAAGIERVRIRNAPVVQPGRWHLPPGTYQVTIESKPARGTRSATVEPGKRTHCVFPR